MKKGEATGSVLSVSSTVYRIVFLGNIVSIHWVSFRVAMNKKILISLFVVACKFIRISKKVFFNIYTGVAGLPSSTKDAEKQFKLWRKEIKAILVGLY